MTISMNLKRNCAYRAALLTASALAICGATSASAVSQLGTAGQFAVLGAATVTNTGVSSVNGDLGVAPGTAITGLETLTLDGELHLANAVALQAQADAALAFATLNALPFDTDLTGIDLGTIGVLTPGVYRFASSAQLTGALTLDFGANPAGAFVFQVGTALTTASLADIIVLNGSADSSVYWLIGSSATLGTGTSFAGNIVASQSITLTTGASIICGRAIALVAAVTMDGNIVSNDCTAGGDFGTGRSDFGSGGFDGIGAVAGVPEPSSWAMMVLGFFGLGAAVRRASGRRSVAC